MPVRSGQLRHDTLFAMITDSSSPLAPTLADSVRPVTTLLLVG